MRSAGQHVPNLFLRGHNRPLLAASTTLLLHQIMPIKGPTYKKGEKVTYTSFGKSCEALILGAHLDDALEPYYTIQVLDGSNREKQTDDAHLSPLGAPAPTQVTPPPHQPTAPMPNYPPPPPPPQVHRQPSVATNKSAARKEEDLPKPQDEPWDMTGRSHPQKKQTPPKPEDARGRSAKTTASKSKQGHDFPWDEEPRSSSSRSHHSTKSGRQSVEAKKRQQKHSQSAQQRQQPQQYRRQQPQQASHHQFDPYGRHYQDPWRKQQQDPFGSFFGGGMPIRSRL